MSPQTTIGPSQRVLDVAPRALRRTAAAARGGFTLVEVLVTLLVMGMILVAVVQILTAARTVRDSVHNIQETQLAGPAVLDLIERDLRGIYTYNRTRQLQLRVKNRVLLGFDGDSLDFVTSSDGLVLQNVEDRWVRADVNEVGYRLRENPTNDQFLEIWRRESFGVDEDPFEGGTYEILCDRVKGLDIQCFPEDGEDVEPVEEWGASTGDENIGLPARIEVTLTIELTPRLVNEQMNFLASDKRTQVYKRVLRFPESLRTKEDEIAVPLLPEIPKPQTPGAGGGSNSSTTTGGGSGGGGKPGGHAGGSGAQTIETIQSGGNRPPNGSSGPGGG